MIILKSLRSRMITFVIIIVIVPIVAIALFYQQQTKDIVLRSFNLNALNQLESTIDIIEGENNNLSAYAKSVNNHVYEEQKDSIGIIIDMIEEQYGKFLTGEISEDSAKQNVVFFLENIHYNSIITHFWIHNTGYPYPEMIADSIYPESDEQLPDSRGGALLLIKKKICIQKQLNWLLRMEKDTLIINVWSLHRRKGNQKKNCSGPI